MAFLFGDSFDLYSSSVDLGTGALINYGNWTGSSNSIQASVGASRFGTGKGITIYSGHGAWKNFASNSTNTVYLAFAYKYTGGVGATNKNGYVLLYDGATEQVTVAFQEDGSIVCLRGGLSGTVVATFTSAFTPQVWNHWQFEIVIDGVNGSVKIRKDGDPSDTYSQTGINTQNGSNSYATAVRLGANSGAWTATIDDFLVYDSSGSNLNTWVGDTRAVILSPNGAGSSTQFTPLSGTNYSMVADTTIDGDTSYTYSSTVDATDLFATTDLSAVPAAIYALNLKVVAKKSDTGFRSFAPVLKSGATTDVGSTIALSSTYETTSQVYSVDPNTGNPWTYNAVNAVETGYKIIA